ncbi:MAG: hypothetical protein AABY64_08460 [Bdellovibrionota bacterium]
MMNLTKINSIFAVLAVMVLSFAASASDSECTLKFNMADRLNPHEVFIGNQFQKKFPAAKKALKLISQLQEDGYCQLAIGQLPACKIDFRPADGYNAKILSFYAVYSGETLVETIRNKSEANEIVNLLKDVRFCR